MAQGDSVLVTNEYSAFQRHHISDEDVFSEFPTVPGKADRDPALLPRIRDVRIYRLGTDEEVYRLTSGDSFEIRIWWRNPRPDETPISIGVGFMRQDMTTCGGMGTHLDGLKVRGTEGCAILRVPDVPLLSGQFLLPVILFDEGGVHKYEEYLIPENLVIRTDTRDVGLFRLAHSWEFTDLPVPSDERTAAEARAKS